MSNTLKQELNESYKFYQEQKDKSYKYTLIVNTQDGKFIAYRIYQTVEQIYPYIEIAKNRWNVCQYYIVNLELKKEIRVKIKVYK
jgi:hypothetical protein